MWTPYSIKTRRPVAVILDIENIDSDVLPDQLMITSVSLAELASGPHATNDPIERARRQNRLQRAEATLSRSHSTMLQRAHMGRSTRPSLPMAENHAEAALSTF
jgi:hypothetical protein